MGWPTSKGAGHQKLPPLRAKDFWCCPRTPYLLSDANMSLSWLDIALVPCPNLCVPSLRESSPGKDSGHKQTLEGVIWVSVQAQLGTCLWHLPYSFCRLPDETDHACAHISLIKHCSITSHLMLRTFKKNVFRMFMTSWVMNLDCA